MLPPLEADIVRRDRDLPGLGTVLDPDAFIKALEPHFPEARGASVQITSIRYRPKRKCIVSYQLVSDGVALELYAKAFPKSSNGEQGRVSSPIRQSEPPKVGRIFLDNTYVLVCIFPHDNKLKVIRRLSNDKKRKKLVSKLLPNRPHLWGGEIRRLQYWPERRFVAQLSAQEKPEVVLKSYRKSEYQVACERATAFRSSGPLYIAKWLGKSDRHFLLAQEYLDGHAFWTHLARPGVERDVGTIVGEALAQLHSQSPEGMTVLTAKAEIDALHLHATWLGFLLPKLAEAAKEIAQRLSAHIRENSPPHALIHGDFHPKQVLFMEDRIGFIDFDNAVLGDPASDLGNFIANLELGAQRGKVSWDRVGPLSEYLLEAYRRLNPRIDGRKVAMYVSRGLFRLARTAFRRHELQWARQTEELLDRAFEIWTKLKVSDRTYFVKALLVGALRLFEVDLELA